MCRYSLDMRKYGRPNPNQGLIFKNSDTGQSMLFIKYSQFLRVKVLDQRGAQKEIV